MSVSFHAISPIAYIRILRTNNGLKNESRFKEIWIRDNPHLPGNKSLQRRSAGCSIWFISGLALMEHWPISVIITIQSGRYIASLLSSSPGRLISGQHMRSVYLYTFGKRKQVTKVAFPVKEQNVSVISTDVNEIS